LCTGWIALDAGHLTLARPRYEKARELAVSAGDVTLAVHALISQSMLHAEMARTGPSPESARQALGPAYQAADEGRYVPMPPLHALIALRHADAASLLGDKAAFQAAIAQARRELNRGPWDGDPPQWLRFVSETEITETEATGYLDLGDAARSAMLYRRVLTSDLSPRNRASNGVGLADALLRQGAHQEAVATATDVLPALESGVTSVRCLNRLRLIRRAVDNIAWAQEFRERFDAAEQALTATCSLARNDAPFVGDKSLGTGYGMLTSAAALSELPDVEGIGWHVAGDESAAVLDQQRRMARGTRPMLDDPDLSGRGPRRTAGGASAGGRRGRDQGADAGERLGPDPVVDPDAALVAVKQPGLMQDLQVVADRGLGQVEGVIKVADARLAS